MKLSTCRCLLTRSELYTTLAGAWIGADLRSPESCLSDHRNLLIMRVILHATRIDHDSCWFFFRLVYPSPVSIRQSSAKPCGVLPSGCPPCFLSPLSHCPSGGETEDGSGNGGERECLRKSTKAKLYAERKKEKEAIHNLGGPPPPFSRPFPLSSPSPSASLTPPQVGL